MGMAIAGTAVYAEVPSGFQLPQGYDPYNLNYSFTPEQYRALAGEASVAAPKPGKRGLMREIKREGSETPQYFVAAQTFHKDYLFNYEGGAVTTYDIGLKVDGDKVTISNFFNLEAQSTEWVKGEDWDVVGTYDAEAHTITIPTIASDLESATVCGLIGDSKAVLVSGIVSEDGQLAPADELVFNVVGDFESLSTDMNFGIGLWYDWYGGIMGFQTLYRRFEALLPGEEPRLMAFNNSVQFKETYPETPSKQSFTVVNVSAVDVDYAVEVEADENAFTVAPVTGTIEARSSQDYELSLVTANPGEYEGIASIVYEGVNENPLPVDILMFGTVIPCPDYSGAVKSGDFKFSTEIDYPFAMQEVDGRQVAHSGLNGVGGTSRLTARFTVPEGNIGTFSWKGKSTNLSYYGNAGGMFVDNLDTPSDIWYGEKVIDGSVELAPGEHVVCFQYDAVAYTGEPKNGLYVYDLELVNTPAEASVVEVLTPEVDLGGFLLRDDGGVSGEGTVVIRSRGLETLSVNTVTSDNQAFEAAVPNVSVGLLETIEIPVSFRAAEAGEYEANLTISTSAGIAEARVKAIVRQMADFSALVTEGLEYVTSFDTPDATPFTMENGVAYNANSGEADNISTTAYVQIDFTVPQGKAAYLSWDGYCYGEASDPEYNWIGDYGYFEIKHPMSSGSKQAYGDMECGSNTLFGDEIWKDLLICIPGDHYFRFSYIKNGDGKISEKDRLEISNFRIHVVDFPEHGVEALTEAVEFEPTYVGPNRYMTATVQLKNTGSSVLEVTGEESSAPFYCVIPEGGNAMAQFNRTIEVGIWFYPEEEGDFTGDVVFKTNAGDVVINCHGVTKPMEGIILCGDVEDEAYGWSFYDADGDGNCWNLGFNLWGDRPEYCHGGNDCFGSNSFTYDVGAIAPDNWLFSPVISIPEDGAMMQWFAAGFNDERYAENYSVYIAEPEQIEDVKNLDSLEPVFTETIPMGGVDGWVENTLDLKEYAGKDVQVIFRHHDCDGQYILRIDDIFVFDMSRWTGVNDVMSDRGDAVLTEIFDINGIRLQGLGDGVNIIRVTYADGTVKTSKIFVKR